MNESLADRYKAELTALVDLMMEVQPLTTKLDDVLGRISVILQNEDTPFQLMDVECLFKWRVDSDVSRATIDLFFSTALLHIHKKLDA